MPPPPPPTSPQNSTSSSDFFTSMEQRLASLKGAKQMDIVSPPSSTSSADGEEEEKTKKMAVAVVAKSFIKRPVLPREAFFVQLRGFSMIGDIAYFTMIDEGWWSLYAFVMKFIRTEFTAGRLRPLTKDDVIPARHVIVCDKEGGEQQPPRLMRCVIMGWEALKKGKDGDSSFLVEVRDVDEASDLRMPITSLYEMPEEGLSVPFRALKVQINKTQLLLGTDIVCRAFEDAHFSTSEVFRAIQVKDTCSLLKKDTFTLDMFTPLKENLGGVILKGLANVCSVPVPQPGTYLPITITHFTDSGEIFYQAILHQRRLLQIIEDFDTFIRKELPPLRVLDPDYSNEEEVKDRLTNDPPLIFAAKYTEDDKYYRAELLGEVGDVIQVHFIDYGNDDLEVALADVVLLDGFDEGLLWIPAMCRSAQLDGIPSLDIDAMNAVLESGQQFKISVVETDPVIRVDLWVVLGENEEDGQMMGLKEVLGGQK